MLFRPIMIFDIMVFSIISWQKRTHHQKSIAKSRTQIWAIFLEVVPEALHIFRNNSHGQFTKFLHWEKTVVSRTDSSIFLALGLPWLGGLKQLSQYSWFGFMFFHDFWKQKIERQKRKNNFFFLSSRVWK